MILATELKEQPHKSTYGTEIAGVLEPRRQMVRRFRLANLTSLWLFLTGSTSIVDTEDINVRQDWPNEGIL